MAFGLPVLLHRLGGEKPPLALFAINVGYHLVSLLAAATLLRVLA